VGREGEVERPHLRAADGIVSLAALALASLQEPHPYRTVRS
jgi:hypothetical protein